MGKVLDRINYEVRTIGGTPWTPWTNPYMRFNVGGPVHPAREAGGVDAALSLACVYACVRLIADSVASLPVNVYRKTPDGPQLVPASQLLTNPSADLSTTLYDWIFQALSSALLWGNAWGLISSRTGVSSPNGLGYPQTIEWLPPDQVAVQDDATQPWNPMRARVYLQGRLIPREQLVHLRAFVVPGRLEAVSPLRAFAQLYGQGLAAQKYGSDFFRNGGFAIGTFQNIKEEIDADQAREIRRRLTDTLRTGQALIFGRDWTYTPVTVPPNEAQFLETMQLNATQVAGIYGVPAWRVGGRRGDSMTYSNQVEEQLDFISTTLRPWLVRMEHLVTSLLPASQYAKFNPDELLRTDLKTRTEIAQLQRKIGTRTLDELRQADDLGPLPGGDSPVPLDLAVAGVRGTKVLPEAEVGQVTPEEAAPGETARSEKRSTEVQRRRAVAWIKTATLAGCIDEAEGARRIECVRTQPWFVDNLNRLTADLPEMAELEAEARPELLRGTSALVDPHSRSPLNGASHGR
jgi:HK97 family phage portal protein